MNVPALKLNQVNKSFDDFQVLENIDLTVEEGEILFLLGASGCGKTTLLRTIAGFETADSGTMHICGKQVFGYHHSLPPKDRHLGYVPQEGVLFPHLNVYRNIAYGLGNGKGKTPEEKDRIHEVMALNNISDLAKRMPHEISGGQQQRVALARALAPHPSIMLLDEPFSALDEHLRAQIREDVIEILRKSKSTAIIVTHDRHEALSSADKIGLLDVGKLVQKGTPEQIYQSPETPKIAQFISENSLLIKARLDSDQQHVKTSLAENIPVEVMGYAVDNCPICHDGQLLIRADQMVPVDAHCNTALLTATISHIEFHGTHSQIDMRCDGTTISVDVRSSYGKLKIGDEVGVKLLGKGLFYPQM